MVTYNNNNHMIFWVGKWTVLQIWGKWCRLKIPTKFKCTGLSPLAILASKYFVINSEKTKSSLIQLKERSVKTFHTLQYSEDKKAWLNEFK